MRIGEHKYAIRRCNIMSNVTVVYVHETEHPIDWDSARVIEREKHCACLLLPWKQVFLPWE